MVRGEYIFFLLLVFFGIGVTIELSNLGASIASTVVFTFERRDWEKDSYILSKPFRSYFVKSSGFTSVSS